MGKQVEGMGPGAGRVLARRYEIEALIGSGAMGQVYRVHDRQQGRPVALKLRRLDQPGAPAGHLEREYHTLAQLAHPSIIEVYDYGVEGVDAFYTMELLDGSDLREHERLPWREACGLLRDVASSLAILHSRRLLHRDLSARNVCRTSAGRAKLIDFGAMMPMGVTKLAVGTPPFVPPEVLQLQALDGRADLYALGALAYYVLTGRHAYPAHELEELRELWQSPPPRPSELRPDLPAGLDELVLELIALDRMARPATAAAVMERLTGIAQLSHDESTGVPRAYLVMPPLRGRDAELQRVRTRLAAPDGPACIYAEGAAGSGRSRFLDACVLEAKLIGALVARADATEHASGALGLYRALAEQLLSAAPEATRRAGRPFREGLGSLLPELAAGESDGGDHGDADRPGRHRQEAALRDLILALSRDRRLVVAIDDLDALDDTALAWIATLVQARGRRKLTLLVTAEPAEAQRGALQRLRTPAERISLGPLSAVETTETLRAVFGDVAHVEAVASRIHALSGGNPRWTMALAEHLVESGKAHYEAGSWSLPAGLGPGDLPASLTEAFNARLATLPPDALSLCQVLSLTDPAALSPHDYPRLTDHGDRARTYAAVDALRSAGILTDSSDGRHRLAQRELGGVIAERLGEARRRTLHGRLADVAAGSGDPVLRPRHLLLAGREREAIEALTEPGSRARIEPSTPTLALAQQVMKATDRLQLPVAVRARLRVWLTDSAALLGHHEIFFEHALPLLERLERDAGLLHYRALDEQLEPTERLTRALERAQADHDALPPERRGLPPATAIPLLGRVCGNFVGMAAVMQDIELLEKLPSLSPLAPLSPAIALVQELTEASIDFQAGRYEAAGKRGLAVLERAMQPDRGGLDPQSFRMLHLSQRFQQGLLAVVVGKPDAPAWVAELEDEPGYRVNAWRVRMTHELMQGNAEAAAECRRRAELLQLRDEGRVPYPGTTNRIELLAYLFAEDVLGLKRTLDRVEEAAGRWGRWDVTVEITRAQYRRLQGDLVGALAMIEPVLARIAPGRHLDWSFAAGTKLAILNDLGRFDEAAALGAEYLEICRRERLHPYLALKNVMVPILAGAGALDRAEALADELLAETTAVGTTGMLLGTVLGTRALVAAARGDRVDFESFATRAGLELTRYDSPALRARFQRLLRDAERHGMTLEQTLTDLPSTALLTGDGTADLRARLARCVSREERAREALSALLLETGATSGHLAGLRDGELRPLYSPPGDDLPPGLLEVLSDYFRSHLEARSAETVVEPASHEETPPRAFRDAGGRSFEPMLLLSRHNGETQIAALAALHIADGERPVPRRRALETIADALLEHDDVDPATRVA